jgi:hypothetical protein
LKSNKYKSLTLKIACASTYFSSFTILIPIFWWLLGKYHFKEPLIVAHSKQAIIFGLIIVLMLVTNFETKLINDLLLGIELLLMFAVFINPNFFLLPFFKPKTKK